MIKSLFSRLGIIRRRKISVTFSCKDLSDNNIIPNNIFINSTIVTFTKSSDNIIIDGVQKNTMIDLRIEAEGFLTYKERISTAILDGAILRLTKC